MPIRWTSTPAPMRSKRPSAAAATTIRPRWSA
jgi:hypothetical protein